MCAEAFVLCFLHITWKSFYARVIVAGFWAKTWQLAFTACEVVDLSLHRGAFEPIWADEDPEQDPDRCCRHGAWGQACWQVSAQWGWNLRLQLGHLLKREPVRTTAFSPALCAAQAGPALLQGYEPPVRCRQSQGSAGRSSGADCVLQPAGSVCCPAGHSLLPQERPREGDGRLRIVSEARIADGRPCQMRPQWQWHGHQAQHPRRLSVRLPPRQGGGAPLLWRDWPRREQRPACIQLLRPQRLEIQVPPDDATFTASPASLSRAERAHTRLRWHERLARNARVSPAGQVTIRRFGVPNSFATSRGLATA